jgi:hypothetical protein
MPNKASPRPPRVEPAIAPLVPPDPALPVRSCRPRSLPPRTVRDRAGKLRRIDGEQLGRPHGHGGARPGRSRRPWSRRALLLLKLAWTNAADPPQPAGISLHSAWLRPWPAPRRGLAAASGCFAPDPSASFVDSSLAESRQRNARECAEVPALSRCRPAACVASSTAPTPHKRPPRRPQPASVPAAAPCA